MTKEVWRNIPTFENYEVSSLSQVRVKPHDILDTDGNVLARIESALLQIHTDDRGAYVLLKQKKYERHYVRDLVCDAFGDLEAEVVCTSCHKSRKRSSYLLKSGKFSDLCSKCRQQIANNRSNSL